jgi:elongation factor 1-gamma
MFDAEGYSLWFCDYKHNDENQVTFVTMNKVGGFLQRMDLARKYAFGKMCILGEEPPFKIKGVWLFRGQDVPQMVLEECYDAELYDWNKVDINNESQKALVNAYFEEPDVIQGEKLLEAKCFK